MGAPAKPFVVALVATVAFSFGAAPAVALEPFSETAVASSSAPAAVIEGQSLNTPNSLPSENISTVLTFSDEAQAAHNFDVEATIALARAEIGTSRATGWNQQGECIMSVQRWIHAGGGAWTGGGDPISNYNGAVRLSIADAQPGDVIQFEHLTYPTSWVSGIHTVLVVGVNDDGTLSIIESNNPAGSGLVSANEHWIPSPPAGFQAVVWRF